MHVPAHAELELLSDIQLGRALVHHQHMLELPAGYFQHPDTIDASQAVSVVAKATLKSKGFVHLLADIIGPATLLQDNLKELHVPIKSSNAPCTKPVIVISKVRCLRTLGFKNPCGTAPLMLNMLLIS